MKSNFSIFYTTCPDSKVATEISHKLLEEKLIACSNILPGMQSHYWWEGKIESASEVIVILKSRSELKDQLQERFRALHPYEIPCFLELALDSGNPDYLQWLENSLK